MKKLIVVMLLLTITSLCFSYPKNKAEAEKLIEAFLQSGKYIKCEFSNNDKTVTGNEYIQKQDVVYIAVVESLIVIYAYWNPEWPIRKAEQLTIKKSQYDIKLDSNNNIIISLVLPTEK